MKNLNRLLQLVREIPIEEVIGSEITLSERGRYLMGLCPFHMDNSLGSFVVTPDLNMYHCFSCGAGGDGINFVMKYHHISFPDAVLKLACDFDILSEEECQKVRKGQITQLENLPDAVETHKETRKAVEKKKAPPKICSNVYIAMAKACGLNEAHKKHLMKERRIARDNLEDFFTFPTRKMDLGKRILFCIRDAMVEQTGKKIKELTEEEKTFISDTCNKVREWLPYVPGFFLKKDGTLDFISCKGIGILVRDETGCVRGIQIRRDKIKNKESRYIWFSSSEGASSSSPAGYVPSKSENRSLCITEGRFKAEALSKMAGDVIYLSGVNNWKSALPILKKVQEERKKVYIAFDADMLEKPEVFEQACGLAQYLNQHGIQAYVLLWPLEKGKGFDDFLVQMGQLNVRKFCRAMSFEKFQKTYREQLSRTLEQYQALSLTDVPKENISSFKIRFLDYVESVLGLKGEKK